MIKAESVAIEARSEAIRGVRGPIPPARACARKQGQINESADQKRNREKMFGLEVHPAHLSVSDDYHPPQTAFPRHPLKKKVAGMDGAL